MKANNLFEENVAFLAVSKFLIRQFGPHSAELYAWLRERRRWLIAKGLIESFDSEFYYKTETLRADWCAPNSYNHLIKELERLQQAGLLEMRVTPKPPYKRYFTLNDEVYFRMADQEAKMISNKIAGEYERKQELKKSKVNPHYYYEDDIDEPLRTY